MGVSLIIGNALCVLLATVFGVSWLFMAKYSNKSDTSFRPWHELAVGRRAEKAGGDVRHRQSATRSAGKRSRFINLSAIITRQNWLEWPVIVGVLLLGLAGWVVKVVLTEDRPGRVLLGDFIYPYWPLQRSECVLAGLMFAGIGSLLIGWSAPARRLFLRWLHHAGFAQSVSMVPKSLRTGSVAVKRGVSEAAAASSAYPETSSTRAVTPSATEVMGDHHGI